jgi:REP element-mobilizing transposase RayT
MLLVTWRLQGSLRQRPHCATTAAVERLLDRETGDPQLLAQARYARIVRRAIARYDGDLYQLKAWVVLHNHVHLLIEPLARISLITCTIMDETEEAACTELWARESYEHVVNGEVGELSHWIESHPVRSGLVSRPEEWEWSSARSSEEVRRVAPLRKQRVAVRRARKAPAAA